MREAMTRAVAAASVFLTVGFSGVARTEVRGTPFESALPYPGIGNGAHARDNGIVRATHDL